MDPARQLRFLGGPILFLLVFALVILPFTWIARTGGVRIHRCFGCIVFPNRFFHRCLVSYLLKLFFGAVFWHCSEVHLEENALRRIWLLSGVEGTANRSREYYA